MRTALLVSCLLACTPAKVPSPYKNTDRSRIERDVTLGLAPDVVLTRRDGTQIGSTTLWEKQRVVVVFYMGNWCPHCKKQLGDLQARQKEFADAGAIIIGISSDPTDKAAALHDDLGLNFELFGDPQLDAIQKFDVADTAKGVARPATFIVEPGGQISFRKVGASMSDRPTTDEILEQLRNSQ